MEFNASESAICFRSVNYAQMRGINPNESKLSFQYEWIRAQIDPNRILNLNNWAHSCNNRPHAWKNGKLLSVRWRHALKSKVQISSNKKYWSIGLKKWTLVCIYAFFIHLIGFAKKIKIAKFRYWKIHVFKYSTRRRKSIFQRMHTNLIHFYFGGPSKDNGVKKLI